MEKRAISAIDLFCGAGGLTKGMENVGIDVLLGVDVDRACEFSYTANTQAKFLHKPVEEIVAEELKSVFYRKLVMAIPENEKEGKTMKLPFPQQSLLKMGKLPLKEIATLALREGRRPRAIYTAHKWFARRLGTVFRALLVGAVSGPEDNFWEAYYGACDLRGFTVLDPFVGGGTSVVEASRLGAKTFAVDVDPIACSVTNLELMAAELPDLEEAMKYLKKKVGKRIRRYHSFVADNDTEYQVLHHFWVQAVTCLQCEQKFDAHPNFLLAKETNTQWVFCSACGNIESRNAKNRGFVCSQCGVRTEIANGRVDYGRAMCPYCKHREPLIEIGRRTGIPEWRQFAVEVLAEPESGHPVLMRNRHFFSANEHSKNRFKAASSACKRREASHPNTFPGFHISNEDRADTRLVDYGYRRWRDLFNPRQLLHLSLLAEEIGKFEEPMRTALAMAYSDHLTTNCMLTSYAAGWRRLTPLFSVRAFRHVPRPVELNPWMDGTGRGSFPNTVRKLMRARAYARSPKEPVLEGGFQNVPVIPTNAQPHITCGSARDLSFLTSKSVDLVLTDPPYFDNIPYSELAEFFSPWLRLLDVIPGDEEVENVMLESLVARRRDSETIEKYTNGFCDAFGEMARVLKPGGIVIFSYRHAKPAAWLALAKAIVPHPLISVRVLPAPGEAGIGLHAHEGTGLWDAVFVLRKDTKNRRDIGDTISLPQEEVCAAEVVADEWMRSLQGAAIPFTGVDRLTIYRASVVAATLTKKKAKAHLSPSVLLGQTLLGGNHATT